MIKLNKILYVLVLFLLLTLSYTSSALAGQTHPAGTLIKQNSTVWKISDEGSSRLKIETPEKFYSNRLSFDNTVPANDSDLVLPESKSIAFGDGVLFSDKGVIYQISGGEKHGFISANVFLGQGFTFDMARPGNLSSIPAGTPVRKSDERHLPGTFVRSSSGTIYLLTSEKSLAFSSAAIFYSHGGKFNEVVPANSADNVSSTTLATYRTGSIVNDNGSVWVVKENSKIGFPSAACFLNFGFTFTIALNGTTSGLTPAGTICGEGSSSGGETKSYNTETVTTSQGSFSASMGIFNLASGKIRVITDTAADRDCVTDCPVASLQAYLTANNGQAGMNGTYFCPSDYAECSGKKNSFFWKVLDTGAGLMVNKDNGLGENDPFLTFDSLGQSKYFKRWVDYKNSGFSAVAGINSASLVENGSISLDYNKLDDKQKNTKATRGAVGIKGQNLYLIHVKNATVPNTAEVLKNLGLENALLMDGGGSSAMMYDGVYKTGPGRNLPNAIVIQILP